MPSNEVLELTPGQVVNVHATTKELLVRVKVRGYGRGRLTVEAVGPGGLFASASKSGPDACDWTAGRTATGWRVVIEPQWWVHESDWCFVRFGFAGPSPVSIQTPSTRLVTHRPFPRSSRPRPVCAGLSGRGVRAADDTGGLLRGRGIRVGGVSDAGGPPRGVSGVAPGRD